MNLLDYQRARESKDGVKGSYIKTTYTHTIHGKIAAQL